MISDSNRSLDELRIVLRVCVQSGVDYKEYLFIHLPDLSNDEVMARLKRRGIHIAIMTYLFLLL